MKHHHQQHEHKAAKPHHTPGYTMQHDNDKYTRPMHPEVISDTASALYASPVTMDGKYFASALVWGMNDIGKDDRKHSVLLEGTQQFPKQALYGRYEFVQKSAEELDLENTVGMKQVLLLISFLIFTS